MRFFWGEKSLWGVEKLGEWGKGFVGGIQGLVIWLVCVYDNIIYW